METTYTKEQVERVVRAYHDWLSSFGLLDGDGNDAGFTVSDINVYSPTDEDGEQMPFSDVVGVFFSRHVNVDEPGHPITIPFEEMLEEVKQS